jgi:hypothetical protein
LRPIIVIEYLLFVSLCVGGAVWAAVSRDPYIAGACAGVAAFWILWPLQPEFRKK